MANIVLSKPNTGSEDLSRIKSSPKFQSWFRKISSNPEITVKELDIRDVDWFGSNLGFLKVNATATDSTGKNIPGIAFVRGDAVGILMKINVTDDYGHRKSYFLMTSQLRLPVGKRCIECPAGMMDNNDNFAGVAAKEIKEETGVVVNANNLVDLGGIYPSPGGCDEYIKLFYYEGEMSASDFLEKQRAIYGVASEGESIKILFVPERKFSTALIEFEDVKAEVAYRRYKLIKQQQQQQYKSYNRLSGAKKCGYSPVTQRCAYKYAGQNGDKCTVSAKGRCAKKTSKRL